MLIQRTRLPAICGLLLAIALVVAPIGSEVAAQSDYFYPGQVGTKVGLSYVHFSDQSWDTTGLGIQPDTIIATDSLFRSDLDYNGLWLTFRYTTDGRFAIGGNFGWLKSTGAESIWLFEPNASYLLIAPQLGGSDIGLDAMLSGRFDLIESDNLNTNSMAARSGAYRIQTTLFYNYWAGTGLILQPSLTGGFAYERLKMWSTTEDKDATLTESDEILGAGLKLFIESGPLKALEIFAGYEHQGERDTFRVSFSFLRNRSHTD